jgi:hypothetical protein
MVTLDVPRTPSRGASIEPDDAAPPASPFAAIWILLLLQTAALVIQVLAVCLARQEASPDPSGWVLALESSGLGLAFASALWFLMCPRLARAVRNTAVVCLGVMTAVQWRVSDPLLLTKGFDEQQHMRTLMDIQSTHGLFQPNPILKVSARYPGLESVTALFHQLGLPVVAAAIAVTLVARVVLVLALCDIVEHLTGSSRAGGLAVAVYAVSAPFVFFDSQFAYQTLALPLALAAVALIARARWVDNPRVLLSGACVCLIAVVMTHHITSWLTVGFLVVWTITQRGGQARRRVFYGAAIATAATTVWAMIQWSLLQEYFGPIMEDWAGQITGGLSRTPFADSAGKKVVVWEQLLIVSYAASVTFVSLWLVLIWARSIQLRLWPGARFKPSRGSTVSHSYVNGAPLTFLDTTGADVGRRASTDSLRSRRGSQATGFRSPVKRGSPLAKRQPQHDSRRWEPRAVLVLIVAMIPLVFAGRIIPSGAEICDRSACFLFLPFSLLVADGVVFWDRSAVPQLRSRPWDGLRTARRLVLVRWLTLVLATSAFLGGYLAGAGPDWGRMPGRYLIEATCRSIDPETLAAVRWARDGLPAGSRIGADFMSSEELASQARLWPVVQEDGLDVQPLYRAEQWGPAQSELARDIHLQYLYVDRRLADGLPRGFYFFETDTPEPLQLTRIELTKFDAVPGVHAVYRHGPISIYALSGLYPPEWPVSKERSGWSGKSRPTIGVPVQLGIGLLLGLALALVGSSVIKMARTFRTAAGPSLTFAAGIGALCAVSVGMLLVHIWLGPTVFLSMALAVLLANRHRATDLLRKGVARLRWRWIAASIVVAVPLAAAIALSVLDASPDAGRRVQEILDDPSAVHIPVPGSTACAWQSTASCDEAR